MMFGSLTAFAGDPAKPADSMKKAPPPAMEIPKPAQQVTDRAKMMTGTWKCDGTSMGMDGKDAKFSGTYVSKADLDGFQIHDSFNGTMAMGKTPFKFKFEMFSSWDTNSKKWHMMMADNWGGQGVGTADEMKDGKMETVAESYDMMGKSQVKDHLDASDLKKGMHMWGEQSKDGKVWNKTYDLTCKK
ncbi:MAG: hypothetical protein ABI678_11280 [Kofleriaceae bacterium]